MQTKHLHPSVTTSIPYPSREFPERSRDCCQPPRNAPFRTGAHQWGHLLEWKQPLNPDDLFCYNTPYVEYTGYLLIEWHFYIGLTWMFIFPMRLVYRKNTVRLCVGLVGLFPWEKIRPQAPGCYPMHLLSSHSTQLLNQTWLLDSNNDSVVVKHACVCITNVCSHKALSMWWGFQAAMTGYHTAQPWTIHLYSFLFQRV